MDGLQHGLPSGKAISSGHPKGANVLFADGSLEFLSITTSPELLKQMLMIGGGIDRFPLDARDRLRLILDSDSTERQPSDKVSRFQLQAYRTDADP